MLSLCPLTCENSLALSHEGWALSEKLIIKVRDNLCHGWLSQRGAAVRLGPYPGRGQNNWTDPVTPVTAAPQRGHQSNHTARPPEKTNSRISAKIRRRVSASFAMGEI